MPLPHAPLLDKLSAATRQDMQASGTERRYRDGKVIHRQGEHNRALQVILDGAVTFSRLDAEGRQVTMTTLGRGDIFGYIPLLTGRPRTHDAIAAGDVQLLHIGPADFHGILARHPDLANAMLAHLAEALAQALDSLDDSHRLTVPQRMARYLLANMDQVGDAAQAPVVRATQGGIAEALNVTREAVAIALKHMRDTGMVTTGYRCIVLTRIDELRKAAKLPSSPHE